MSDDPKEGLAAALAEAGPGATLTALRCAIALVIRSLSSEVGDDDILALECVIGLDDTLPDLERLLAVVPAMIKIASPGRSVEERIADGQARLDQQIGELADKRAALAQAGDIERRLARTQAERDELLAQIDMLEQQEQLAGQLPRLQASLAKLREAVDEAAVAPVAQVAQGLVRAVRELAQLTDAQRTLIGADLAQQASRAVTTGQALEAERIRLGELTVEVTRRQAEADELEREYKQTLPGLELYRQADEALAAALADAGMPSADSSLGRVRRSFAEIKQLLSDVDAALKPLLDQHATAYNDSLAVRNW